MKKPKMVLVEVNEHGHPIRIFRTVKAAMQLPVECVQEWTKAKAVEAIRRQVYQRSKVDGYSQCESCSTGLSWETGEMHEKHPKGKRDENGNYGEVSVENGLWLCRGCHTGRPDSAHGDRRWHTAKVTA